MDGEIGNRMNYFISLSRELESQANRVRNLIGDAHWLSDGHHKEALLGGLIKRFVPSGVSVGRGFVLEAASPSKEQDLLLVDRRQEAPLFFENDLLVALPETVIGALSVKTQCEKKELTDALGGVASISSNEPWRGIYFFASPATERTLQGEADLLRDRAGELVSHDVAVRLSADRFARITQERVTVHSCPGLSTAFLLASLLNHITARFQGTSWFAETLDRATEEQEVAVASR